MGAAGIAGRARARAAGAALPARMAGSGGARAVASASARAMRPVPALAADPFRRVSRHGRRRSRGRGAAAAGDGGDRLEGGGCPVRAVRAGGVDPGRLRKPHAVCGGREGRAVAPARQQFWVEGVDRVRHGAPAGQPGARAGLLCAARGQPHAVGQPADDGAAVRVPVLRRLLDQRGGVVAGRGGGGAERPGGGERGDQAVRDLSGGLGSFFLAPHPGPLPWRGEGIRFFLAPHPGPLPWRGEGIRSFSPLTLALSPEGERGYVSFSPLTLALPPGGEGGYVLSCPSPWPSSPGGVGEPCFLALPPSPSSP